jgi:hypothetical protein
MRRFFVLVSIKLVVLEGDDDEISNEVEGVLDILDERFRDRPVFTESLAREHFIVPAAWILP